MELNYHSTQNFTGYPMVQTVLLYVDCVKCYLAYNHNTSSVKDSYLLRAISPHCRCVVLHIGACDPLKLFYIKKSLCGT